MAAIPCRNKKALLGFDAVNINKGKSGLGDGYLFIVSG
jgi:hypothetical protein